MAEFRTTFVPKTSSTQPTASSAVSGLPPAPNMKAKKGFGIVTGVLVALLFASLLLAVLVYGIDRSIGVQINQLAETLNRSQKEFEPQTILELKELDSRLKVSNTLLAHHVSLSAFLTLLGEQTLPGVAFDSFRFTNDAKQGMIIAIAGRSISYEAIAEQSAIFGDDSRIKQHVFSNFKLLNTGYVSFDLTITPAPRGILYGEAFTPATNTSSAETTPSVMVQPVDNANNPLFNTGAPTTSTSGQVITQPV